MCLARRSTLSVRCGVERGEVDAKRYGRCEEIASCSSGRRGRDERVNDEGHLLSRELKQHRTCSMGAPVIENEIWQIRAFKFLEICR